jgi:hypothetical protein
MDTSLLPDVHGVRAAAALGADADRGRDIAATARG